MWPSATRVDPRISLGPAGLSLGADTKLARCVGATARLAIDEARLEALFAVAFQREPSDRDVSAIEAAATHWQRGDKALANLRLVFADLPRLEQAEDAVRLKAAELLFDAGLRADDLEKVFETNPPAEGLEKYDPNQPRIPAGSGKESGRWASLWTRFSAWLDEEVPERDQDTGLQVGTQTRARAILTNPLTFAAAGTAALLGGEALLPAAAVVAPEAGLPAAVAEAAAPELGTAIIEAEALSSYEQRYLSISGGRLGTTPTRQQLHDIAGDFAKGGRHTEIEGDGYASEEFIRGSGPGTKGGTFVDLTAKAPDGSTVRVQTINTLADGRTPTKVEADAAARIRAAFPKDKLLLIPKRLK